MTELFKNRLAAALAGPVGIDGMTVLATIDGTAGDDSLMGTATDDVFHLEAGGDDTAMGGSGQDIFYMGEAFNADDRIDGGASSAGLPDMVILDGDYSAGTVLSGDTLVSIEMLQLIAGHDYDLTLGVSPAGGVFTIAGDALGPDDSLVFDASAVTDHALSMAGGGGADRLVGGQYLNTFRGGGGADTLIGGAAFDTFYIDHDTALVSCGAGDDYVIAAQGLGPKTEIEGGAGELGLNRLYFNGRAFGGTALSGAHVRDIGLFLVMEGGRVVIKDGLARSGNTLMFSGANNLTHLIIDGSREQNDGMTISGGARADHFIGGGGGDELHGGARNNTLEGGAGDDQLFGAGTHNILVGGAGADTIEGSVHRDTFVYLSTKDSTAAAADVIKLDSLDVVDLEAIDADRGQPGNQAFHLVEAFTGKAGELVLSYDTINGVTRIAGDVDGDGAPDLLIEASGDHTGFTNFAL